jgi:hypothetical protein
LNLILATLEATQNHHQTTESTEKFSVGSVVFLFLMVNLGNAFQEKQKVFRK